MEKTADRAVIPGFNPEFIPERKFMERALELSREAEKSGDIPVGAVIELKGEIIGEGFNTRERDKDPLGHAEINAIKKAAEKTGDWRLTGARMYVTLEPCRMCSGAAVNARIDTVVYGAEDIGFSNCVAEELNKCSPSHKIKVYRGFMESECKAALSEFFKSIRNK